MSSCWPAVSIGEASKTPQQRMQRSGIFLMRHTSDHSWPRQRDGLLQREAARHRLKMDAHGLLLTRYTLEKKQLPAEVQSHARGLPVIVSNLRTLNRKR